MTTYIDGIWEEYSVPNFIQSDKQVVNNVGVGVLVNRNACRRVRAIDFGDAARYTAFGYGFADLWRYIIKILSVCGEGVFKNHLRFLTFIRTFLIYSRIH